MRRLGVWVLSVAMMAVLAAGCGGSGGGGTEAPGTGAGGTGGANGGAPGGSTGQGQSGGGAGTQLTVVGPWSGPELDQFNPVLKEAEKELGVSITFRTQRYEDLAAGLPAQLEAQEAPGDIVFMWDWWVKQNAQHAADLRDIWQPEAAQFRMPAAEASGKVVAVPYAISVKPGFWYRKSFFEKNGLKPPATWEEFVALLEKMSKIKGVKKPIASGDGVGWPLSDVTEHFLITFGGPQLQRDLIAGKVKWTDPQVKSVFRDRLVPVLKYSSDPIEWTQGADLWWNGEYGLFFMGNWLTGMVKDPADLGVFALPGAKGVVASTDYAFVPQYGKHVEEAKKLLAFLIGKKGMEIRAKQGGKLSGRSDVGPEAHPASDRPLVELLSGMELLPDLDDTIGGDWQRTFWDQLKLLWVQPDAVDDVLQALQDQRK